MSEGVVRLLTNGDPEKGMEPSNMVDAEAFTSGDQTELNHTFFAKDDESILVGVWECAPCLEDIEAYPVYETMTVISGSVTITKQGGEPQTFTAGDTFFIAKGTKCTWQITETLRKFYTIVE